MSSLSFNLQPTHKGKRKKVAVAPGILFADIEAIKRVKDRLGAQKHTENRGIKELEAASRVA